MVDFLFWQGLWAFIIGSIFLFVFYILDFNMKIESIEESFISHSASMNEFYSMPGNI